MQSNKELKTKLMEKYLGFCNCGNPDAVLNLIFYFIALSETQRERECPAFSGPAWEAYCEKKQQEKRNLIIEHADAVTWLLYYFLDAKEIFIHGGNVSGGWLEDNEFFELLTQWNTNQMKEEETE